MSFFITLEGIEGSGKSTQLLRLQKYLEEAGYPTLATREPGGCLLSDQIRRLLLDPANNKMAAATELLLYSAARAQHVEEIIRPALAAGKVVVCDRFSDATTVYQGAGRGLDLAQLTEINNFATSGLTPDMTLLLDYPVEEGLHRAQARNLSNNLEAEGRFELEALSFHQRIRSSYLELAAQQARFHVIDALGSEETVFARIAVAMEPFLAGRRTA